MPQFRISGRHHGHVGCLRACLVLGLALGGCTKASPPEPQPQLDQRGEGHGPPAAVAGGLANIFGRVLDPGGSPVIGTQVCLLISLLEPDDPGPGRWRQSLCTRADDQGRYRFDDLPPLRVMLSASAPGHIPSRWSSGQLSQRRDELSLHPGEVSEDIDMTVAPGGVPVLGFVRDPLGVAVEGASVSLSRADAAMGSQVAWTATTTDADGRFELWTEAGPVALFASAEGLSGLGEQYAVAPTERAELTLHPESTLAGVVVDERDGSPIVGATILVRSNIAALPDPRVPMLARARSDHEGRFEVRGLYPGRSYELEAVTDHARAIDPRSHYVGYGQRVEGIELRAAPGQRVDARIVIAETGEPCRYGWAKFDGQLRYVDDRGELHLRGLAPGTQRGGFGCEGFSTESRIIEFELNGDIEDMRWTVHDGPRLRGVVVDREGVPIPNTRVFAVAKDRGADAVGIFSGLSRHTGSDGRFEIGRLSPARYELTLDSYTWPDPDPPLQVGLGPDDLDDVRVVAGATGRLSGTALDRDDQPIPGVQLWLGGGRGQSIRCDDAGRFELDDLAVGDYEISVLGSGSGYAISERVTIELEPDGDVDVDVHLRPFEHRITGRVVDTKGEAVAGAFISYGLTSRVDTDTLRQDYWTTERSFSDDEGAFVLEALGESRYSLVATEVGGRQGWVVNVDAGTEGIEVRVDHPPHAAPPMPSLDPD